MGAGGMQQPPGSSYYVNQRGPHAPQHWASGSHQAASSKHPGDPLGATPAGARGTHVDAAGMDQYGVVRVGAKPSPAALPPVAENRAVSALAPAPTGQATRATSMRVR